MGAIKPRLGARISDYAAMDRSRDGDASSRTFKDRLNSVDSASVALLFAEQHSRWQRQLLAFAVLVRAKKRRDSRDSSLRESVCPSIRADSLFAMASTSEMFWTRPR